MSKFDREIVNGSVCGFFEMLLELRGIGKLNGKLHNLLCEMQEDLSDNARKILYLYLSLLDDGNTRIALDSEALAARWKEKWTGLVELARSGSAYENEIFATADDFQPLIESGIRDIIAKRYERIIEWRTQNTETDETAAVKPFVAIGQQKMQYLYATKYFDAKCVIERSMENLFRGGVKPAESDIEKCRQEVAEIHQPIRIDGKECKFELNREQAEAVLRGQNENLIVTGGPGTGKTTVVLYILWNLLKKLLVDSMRDTPIYLAAPSGKAADRMRESLVENLETLTDSEKQANIAVFKKLRNLESKTLHRLLVYSPRKNAFTYNHKNQFPANSLFVIDEASMIDISMFAAFLEALPPTARLFILGDPFQLPSVDAGAVLGEMLRLKNSQRNFTVNLIQSKRFSDTSAIGNLANSVKKIALSGERESEFEAEFFDFENRPDSLTGDNAVKFISLNEKASRKETEKDIEKIISEWTADLKELPALAARVNPGNSTPDQAECEVRNRIWTLSLSKRILSAEKRGPRGVENLNKLACKHICDDSPVSENGYFPGQLLILTRNQTLYKLYNGDTGIVVFSDDRPYLMLKKTPVQGGKLDKAAIAADAQNNFVFYPLSLLPSDAIESAFAITIHKSQGSEYAHVLMFLPQKIGHPLLTNQILYTGITRAKKSVAILSSAEAFVYAGRNVTGRDTGIEM